MGIIELTIIIDQAPIWPCSSVVECLHQNRKGHEFEFCRGLNYFSGSLEICQECMYLYLLWCNLLVKRNQKDNIIKLYINYFYNYSIIIIVYTCSHTCLPFLEKPLHMAELTETSLWSDPWDPCLLSRVDISWTNEPLTCRIHWCAKVVLIYLEKYTGILNVL